MGWHHEGGAQTALRSPSGATDAVYCRRRYFFGSQTSGVKVHSKVPMGGLVSDECLNSIILHNIHYVTTRRWRLSYCFHRNWPDFLGASQDVMIYFYQNAADANRNNAFFLLFGIDPTFGIPESRDVTIVTLWIF